MSTVDPMTTELEKPAAIACLSPLERHLLKLATDIRDRNRCYIRDLRIELVRGGVIVRGHAVCFYGKQIAFHEVSKRCRLPVLANEVEVQQRPGDAAR